MSSRLDELLAAFEGSNVIRRLWSGVYGTQYVAEHAPLGFVTRDELARIADAVVSTSGTFLVDVGCGAGGPGVAVALATERDLVGVDPSAAALELTLARARNANVHAECIAGEFARLPFSMASLSAVMSVDALQVAPDKPAALAEVARVLVDGGIFAFTAWQDHPSTPVAARVVRQANVDYAARLVAAGFEVEALIESVDAVERQLEVYAAVVAATAELQDELGAPANLLIEEARSEPARLRERGTRRITVVARRRTPTAWRHS